MINCLHICNDFLGSGIYKNLYQALNKLNIQQTIYHPYRNKKKTIKIEALNIVYSKPLKKYHRILFRVKCNYLYNDLTQKIPNLNTFDIVHATTLFSDGAVALMLYRKFKIPYVVNVRATDLAMFLKYRKDLYPIGRAILDNAKEIIFISNSLKEKFFNHLFIKKNKTNYKLKSHILYNGISCLLYTSPSPRDRG